MVDVAPGLITNGLGGTCTNVMLGFFHLGFLEVIIPGSPQIPGSPPIPPGSPPIPPVEPPLHRPGGTGGGYYPPRRDIEDYPPEQKIEVIIRVRFSQVWHERTYWVLPKNASIIIKVINFANTTLSRLKLRVSNVRNKMKALKATISNITNKSDEE